jgi:hypothetical protein
MGLCPVAEVVLRIAVRSISYLRDSTHNCPQINSTCYFGGRAATTTPKVSSVPRKILGVGALMLLLGLLWLEQSRGGGAAIFFNKRYGGRSRVSSRRPRSATSPGRPRRRGGEWGILGGSGYFFSRSSLVATDRMEAANNSLLKE